MYFSVMIMVLKNILKNNTMDIFGIGATSNTVKISIICSTIFIFLGGIGYSYKKAYNMGYAKAIQEIEQNTSKANLDNAKAVAKTETVVAQKTTEYKKRQDKAILESKNKSDKELDRLGNCTVMYFFDLDKTDKCINKLSNNE